MPKKPNNQTNSTVQVMQNLESILRELELAYNLSPVLSTSQINRIHRQLLQFVNGLQNSSQQKP